ncbi:MAG: HTTM domain-containing protein [Oligoflexia bacterium]|nr:HTTM domain-containing protein [Oligoflexia bacterium]
MIKKYFEKDNTFTTNLFMTLVYAIALIEIIIRLPNAKLFYGSLHKVTEIGDLNGVNYIFDIFHLIPNAYIVVLSLYIASLLINLTNLKNIFSKTSAWYLCGVLNFYNPSIADGGSAVILIFMFYAIFLNDSKNYYLKALNNMFLLLIQLQVCFIYLSAGLTKLNGQLWTRGVATYYALQVDQFSHPILQQYFAKNAFFVTLSSLGTLAFQLSFPYLIWNKKTRPYVAALGSLIHLQISFGMGLVTFGLIMSVSYFSFYNEEEIKKVLNRFKLSQVSVFFDHECINCMRFARLMRILIPKKSLIIKDANKKDPSFLETLHLTDGQRVYQGFSAICQMVYRAPILKIASPVFYLIEKSGLGAYFYDQYILKSNWRNNCREGVCTLNYIK